MELWVRPVILGIHTGIWGGDGCERRGTVDSSPRHTLARNSANVPGFPVPNLPRSRSTYTGASPSLLVDPETTVKGRVYGGGGAIQVLPTPVATGEKLGRGNRRREWLGFGCRALWPPREVVGTCGDGEELGGGYG